MKRSRMPDRTTPLRTATPLARTSRLQSSGPIKAKRRDTGPTARVRTLVHIRAEGCCEICGQYGTDIHHRVPRGVGGSSDPRINLASALLLLCRKCHRWIEENRAAAYAAGWLVRCRRDPAATAVRIGGQRCYLTDDGRYHFVDHQEAS